MGAKREATLLKSPKSQSPHVAQETFTGRRTISIPTYDKKSNTVMAVAADSHRRFLIPEYTVLQYTRQRITSMNCVYSFVYGYYNTFFE